LIAKSGHLTAPRPVHASDDPELFAELCSRDFGNQGPLLGLPLAQDDNGITAMQSEIHRNGLHVRQLETRDLGAIERHLLELSLPDRRARFLHSPSDAAVAAYARRLDPSKAILIGAFDRKQRLIGLAEAHWAEGSHAAEIGITIDANYRLRGLGQQLITRAMTLAFARNARSAQFNFAPDNNALTRLVRALGARIGTPLGFAEIFPATNSFARRAA
jgi:ribosomal protein S18 acetylase RimI-like enzyme